MLNLIFIVLYFFLWGGTWWLTKNHTNSWVIKYLLGFIVASFVTPIVMLTILGQDTNNSKSIVEEDYSIKEKYSEKQVKPEPKEFKVKVGTTPSSNTENDWGYRYSERNYNDPFRKTDVIHKTWVFILNDNDSSYTRTTKYALPVWDKSVVSTNKVLTYLGLPSISSITVSKNGRGNHYSDPNYPLGKISFTHGKYCDCLGAVNLIIDK